MTRDEILRAVETVAREHLQLEGRLTPDLRLAEDLRLDSVQLLTLAVEVENRLQVALDPEDDAAIATVGDLVEAVWRRSGDGG
jgi:acyl carrier protein